MQSFILLLYSAVTISVTSGSPFCDRTCFIECNPAYSSASSKADAFLNIIPFFAPTPFPSQAGVASPSAHGQLITNTEIPLAMQNQHPVLPKAR